MVVIRFLPLLLFGQSFPFMILASGSIQDRSWGGARISGLSWIFLCRKKVLPGVMPSPHLYCQQPLPGPWRGSEVMRRQLGEGEAGVAVGTVTATLPQQGQETGLQAVSFP